MKKIATAIFLSLISTLSIAGQERGGADSVICFANDVNSNGKVNSKYLYAHYTLDYLSAVNNGTELEEYRSNPEALKSVIALLKEKAPKLGINFEKFVQSYNQRGRDLLSEYRWVSKSTVDIPDEHLIDLNLPDICEKVLPRLKGFKQAVTRVNSGKYVSLYYSPAAFQNTPFSGGFEIKGLENNGIQLSWILFHEFLRDYIQDSSEIRRVAELVFSKQLATTDAAQLVDFLKSAGVLL